MIVAFAPSPALDRTLVVDAVTPGAIHRPHTVVAVAGGKGLNVARAAHALGAPVTAVTALGGAIGDGVRRLLGIDGVPHVAVPVAGETRICTTIAAVAPAGLTEFYEPATALLPQEWARLESELAQALDAGASWLTVSGSLPAGAPDDALRRLVEAAHARGVQVAADTHGPALAEAVAAGADLVKVNVDEARDLLGRPDAGPREVALALDAAAVAATGAPRALTVVTAGTLGAWAVGRGQVRHVGLGGGARTDGLPHGPFPHGPFPHGPFPVGRFPVGSGDCFLAGLVSGLAADPGGADAALELAGVVAAANAQRPGAAVFDAGQVRAAVARPGPDRTAPDR